MWDICLLSGKVWDTVEKVKSTGEHNMTTQEKILILEAKRIELDKQWQAAGDEARYWLEQEIASIESKIYALTSAA
jgi:hypothetical protein